MDKNTVVIAIDHGWSNMKTVHETFTSGIREITTEPALFENVLEKDGKYYKVGSERLKVKDSKVEDENYYLLSLAATAKELATLLLLRIRMVSVLCLCRDMQAVKTTVDIRISAIRSQKNFVKNSMKES